MILRVPGSGVRQRTESHLDFGAAPQRMWGGEKRGGGVGVAATAAATHLHLVGDRDLLHRRRLPLVRQQRTLYLLHLHQAGSAGVSALAL